MPSESARMSTAAEARFRINAPNSQPRAVKVIALDSASEAVVRKLADAKWNRASFLKASGFSAATASATDKWLSDMTGNGKKLTEEIDTADLIVMIATAGENAAAAEIISNACRSKRVMTTALIVGSESKSDQALAQTLAKLRPNALMVVIASSDEYIEDMLTALRA